MTPMGLIIALNRKTQSTFGWGSRGQNSGGGGGGGRGGGGGGGAE